MGTFLFSLPAQSHWTAAFSPLYLYICSREINRFMVHPSLHAKFPAFEGEKTKLQGSLKRCMTSGEDMVRAAFKPQLATSPEVGAPGLAAASRVFLSDRVASLREVFRQTPRHLGFNVELKYPTAAEAAAMRTKIRPRNELVDAVLRVALEEGRGRKIIFSTFDPDCATLLSLKQPRYPVFFLTCGGAKDFADPRMNSLEAALQFALASHLQGVVAEAGSVLPRLHEVVEQFHCHGLFLFTWGEINNDIESYLSQREAGVDAIIIDDVARIARATNKQISLFNTKSIKSPASLRELMTEGAASMPAPGHFDTDALTGMLESLSGISMVALGAMEAPSSNA
jgi:glycerophosphoryl diester phosphodiesterase